MHKSHKTHNNDTASTLHLNKMGIILKHYEFRLDQTNNTKVQWQKSMLRVTTEHATSKLFII